MFSLALLCDSGTNISGGPATVVINNKACIHRESYSSSWIDISAPVKNGSFLKWELFGAWSLEEDHVFSIHCANQ